MNNILDGIVDKKIGDILNVFIKNGDEIFHLSKIAEESNVPVATSFRIIKKLVDLGFITIIRINKFKVYKLAKNKKTMLLIKLLGK